jgi:glycosyltransferase involved in cell wall biosynthesis
MMIHGLPVVASATTGLNEIVDDGFSGFRVPMVNNSSNEIDTNMMAQRIIYLLQNPEERKKLGKNGRERYLEKYTTSLMYEKMTHCYFKLFQILSDYKNRCCSTGINY